MPSENSELGLGIGSRLRLARISQDITRKEFAIFLGTSASYLSEIESGKKIPGGELLAAIRKIFFVNINWLLTGAGWTYDFVDANDIEKFMRSITEIKQVLIISHHFIPDESRHLEWGNSFVIELESGCISLHGATMRSYRFHANNQFLDMPFYRVLFLFAAKNIPIFSMFTRKGQEFDWDNYDLSLLFQQKGVVPFDMKTMHEEKDITYVESLNAKGYIASALSEFYLAFRAIASGAKKNLKPDELKNYLEDLRKRQKKSEGKVKQLIETIIERIESKNNR